MKPKLSNPSTHTSVNTITAQRRGAERVRAAPTQRVARRARIRPLRPSSTARARSMADDDEWETDPDFVNDMTEAQQRAFGNKETSAPRPAV